MRTRGIFLAAGLAVVASLLLAGAASAGGRSYSGTVAGDDAATVTLQAKKRDGKWSVTAFVARNFLISCEGGVQARLGSVEVHALPGAIPVSRKGRFSAKVEKGPKVVDLAGRFGGSGSVSGTLRYSGLTTVTVNGTDENLDCESDVLNWRATRVQTTGRIAASTPWSLSRSPVGRVM
jgi:hypothetical protein